MASPPYNVVSGLLERVQELSNAVAPAPYNIWCSEQELSKSI